MSLSLNLSINIWIERYTPPTFGSDLKFNLMGLIPVISQAMSIPKLSNLFKSLCL